MHDTATVDACSLNFERKYGGVNTFAVGGTERHGSRELRYFRHANSEREEIELIRDLFQWRPHAIFVDRWRRFPDLPRSPGGFPTIVELDVETERFMGIVRLAPYFGTNASLVWVLATPGPGNGSDQSHEFERSRHKALSARHDRAVRLTNGRIMALLRDKAGRNSMGQALGQRGAGAGSANLGRSAKLEETEDSALQRRGVHFLDTVHIASSVGDRAANVPLRGTTRVSVFMQAQAALSLLCRISMRKQLHGSSFGQNRRIGCHPGTCTECNSERSSTRPA